MNYYDVPKWWNPNGPRRCGNCGRIARLSIFGLCSYCTERMRRRY